MAETLKTDIECRPTSVDWYSPYDEKVGNNFTGVSLEVCLGDFEYLIGIANCSLKNYFGGLEKRTPSLVFTYCFDSFVFSIGIKLFEDLLWEKLVLICPIYLLFIIH
jgi:hypothetical protein